MTVIPPPKSHDSPFIFILGRGRSGTTLLRAMLASHPQLAIPPESHFIIKLCRAAPRFGSGSGFDRQGFADALLETKDFAPWEMSASDVRRAVDSADDAPSAICSLYGVYAAQKGKSRYGDKTPIHVLHMTSLAKWFPEGRFIHIIRDGRDVALSYLDVEFGPNTVEEAAVYWDRFVRRGRLDGKALGSERYLEVRYEELIGDPMSVLQSVCSFAALPYTASMLDYWKEGNSWAPASGADHHRNLSRPPTRGLRDWRQEMSHSQVATFEAVAGRLLRELDYPLQGQEAPMRRSMRYIRAQGVVQARRVVRHVTGHGWYSPSIR